MREGFDAHFGAVVVGDGSFDAREMVVGVAVVVAVVVGCKGGGVVWACRTRCHGGVLDVVVVNYYWLLGLGDSADGVHDGGCIWISLRIGEEGVKVEVSARHDGFVLKYSLVVFSVCLFVVCRTQCTAEEGL